MENPANRGGAFAGSHLVWRDEGKTSAAPADNQWLLLEREAVRRSRSALLCRGSERLNALAIAAAYANAARAAALSGGVR